MGKERERKWEVISGGTEGVEKHLDSALPEKGERCLDSSLVNMSQVAPRIRTEKGAVKGR